MNNSSYLYVWVWQFVVACCSCFATFLLVAKVVFLVRGIFLAFW